jgi:hypothetical protein
MHVVCVACPLLLTNQLRVCVINSKDVVWDKKQMKKAEKLREKAELQRVSHPPLPD